MRRIWSALVMAVVVTMGLAVLPTVTPAQANGTNIVVLGGSSAVSDSVLSELATCTSGSVSRIAGTNRYDTAAKVSATFLSPGIDVAYVATGENFPDALAGSAAAGAGAGGPVLLVRPTSVPSETAAELNRLNPKTIVVLGGTAAISAGVESALGAYGTVVRVAGSNRYSTGSLVSSYAFPAGANTAYVATGTNFPDALAGGPAAVAAKGPVLLVDPNSIPSSVGAELARLGLSSIRVLGGTAAVSASVETGLKAYAPVVTRLSGPNRYATAAAVSKDTFSPGVGTIFIATGTNFPDALAGGPIAGILGGPILLTDPNSIPGDTRNEIQRLTGTTCGPVIPPPTDKSVSLSYDSGSETWSGAVGSESVKITYYSNVDSWSGSVGSDSVSLRYASNVDSWSGSIGSDTISLSYADNVNTWAGWIASTDRVFIPYSSGLTTDTWGGYIGSDSVSLSRSGSTNVVTGSGPRTVAAIMPIIAGPSPEGWDRYWCTWDAIEMWGDVYLTSSYLSADVPIYEVPGSSSADLVVTPVSSSSFANSCGKWHFTTSSTFADFDVWFASTSSPFDLHVYFTGPHP